LTYNTQLLEGLAIPLTSLDLLKLVDKLKWTIGDLLVHLGVSLRDLFQNLGLDALVFLAEEVGAEWLADILGVHQKIQEYINDVLDFSTFGLWGAITSWSEVTIDMVLEAAGIDPFEALEQALGPFGVVRCLVERLGWEVLRAIFGKDVPDVIHVEPEDDVPGRSKEIGQALGTQMDITGGATGVPRILLPYALMALCETFSGTPQTTIADQLGRIAADYTFVPGPGASGHSLEGSGLLDIIKGYPVIERRAMAYSARGDQFDVDYWGNKGVLLTRVDVGHGVIDLFSTHLFAGATNILSDILDAAKMPNEWKSTSADKAAVRAAQLEELASFIGRWHPRNSPNIAILAGDFNIGADSDEYNHLKTIMDALGLRDEWLYQRVQVMHEDPRGYTSGTEAGTFSLDEDGVFCNDPDPSQVKKGRIDFVFTEQPRPEHAFNLDVTRFRRRPFLRAGKRDKYMSDHMGLDATLIFSSRNTA
jgi:hypothetical protein